MTAADESRAPVAGSPVIQAALMAYLPLRSAWLAEVLCLTLVLGAAVAIRLPYLLVWPAFTDEAREVLVSIALARGQLWPWTSFEAYTGPLHVYLLAGLLKITGLTIWAPRLLTTMLNVVAVGLVYALGRRLAGRAGGLVAAGLVAVSPLWVLTNSHVAWAASTTPTYVLGALLAAHIALGGPPATWRGPDARRGRWLVVAGLLLGLAAQAHPTALTPAAGLALAVIWGAGGLARLRSPWPWLGAAAVLVGYAPMLIYNIFIAPGASLAGAQGKTYAWEFSTDPRVLFGRAPQMWWNEWRALAGVGETDIAQPLTGWPLVPVAAQTLLVLALAGWGVWIAWRRGERLLPLALAPWFLLIPLVTDFTGDMWAERYLAPAAGLVAALVAVALVRLARGRVWLTLALGGLLLILPTRTLFSYYGQQAGAPNEQVMATAEALRGARGCVLVLLDRDLSRRPHLNAGGTTLRALRLALSLAGVPWQTELVSSRTLTRLRNAHPGIQIIAVLKREKVDEQELTPRLTHIGGASAASGLDYDVYLDGAAALPDCPGEREHPIEVQFNN